MKNEKTSFEQRKNARSKSRDYYFSRTELSSLLSAYSLRVAVGDWRDYALDHSPQAAMFSIFKHAYESPMLVIEKRKPRSRKDAAQFFLHDRHRTLIKTSKITELLDYLHRMPRLVK